MPVRHERRFLNEDSCIAELIRKTEKKRIFRKWRIRFFARHGSDLKLSACIWITFYPMIVFPFFTA